MEQIHNKKYLVTCKAIILTFCLLLAMVSFTETLFDVSQVYQGIVLLPATFVFVTICLARYFSEFRHNFAMVVIYFGYMARMVITPFFFCLGGCSSFLLFNFSDDVLFSSCILISGEFIAFAIVCMLWRSSKERKRISCDSKSTIVDVHIFRSSSVVKILIPLVLFMVTAYWYIPELQTIYWPIFGGKISGLTSIFYDNETLVQRGGIQRYIYSMFRFLWPIVRLMLPSFLIAQVYKRNGHFLWVALSMVIPCILLSDDNIAPLFCSLITLFIIARLYPKQFPRLLFIVSILGIMFLAIVLPEKFESLQRWRGGSGIVVVAQMLQAYLPGFDNTAVVKSIPRAELLETLFADLYYAIPFKETLFGLNITNLSQRFSLTSNLGGQILPFSAQLNYYLPMPMVWFVIGILMWLAIKYYDKSKSTDNFWRLFQYIYFSMITAVSFSIYSFSIYIRDLVNIYVPILAIVWMVRAAKKRKISKNYSKKLLHT